VSAARKPRLPICLPQFNSVNRFYDRSSGADAIVKLMPAEYYVTHYNELITTVLGSCVAVCICDPKNNIGGMNHFLLPENEDKSCVSDSTRYGSHAMEQLVNDIMRNGGKRENFIVKVFGGADMPGINSGVGARNARFITSYLRQDGFKWSAEDLGGQYPRWLKFNPMTGKAQVKYMPVSASRDICQQEAKVAREVKKRSIQGGDFEML